MGYVFLGLAIVGEVIATTFLKFTSGEKAVWWAYAIVGVGYVFAFGMLSLALGRGVPLGTAYAIWAGVGVVLVAVIAVVALVSRPHGQNHGAAGATVSDDVHDERSTTADAVSSTGASHDRPRACPAPIALKTCSTSRASMRSGGAQAA